MFKNFYSIMFFSMLLIIILMFSACEKSKKTPVIGVIVATSGRADFIGKPEEAVLKKLREVYISSGQNIYGIEFKFKDSGGDPGQALTAFNFFNQNPSVIAIIGPSTSGESIPLAERANVKKIPLLSLAASKKIVILPDGKTNPWAFKFAQNDDLAARRLTLLMTRLIHTNVALLYSNDGFGKSGAEVFKKAAENSNISIIHQVSFPPQLDLPEPFVQAIPKDVQGVVIWGTAPGPALLVQALKNKGYNGQIYLSHGNASEAFIESCGAASEGVIIVGSRVLTGVTKLVQDNPADEVIFRYRMFWQQNFKGAPSHFAGHARDAFEAVLSILPKIDLNKEFREVRESVRDELEKLTHYHGVTGTFNFSEKDHAGLGIDSFETYVIEDGKFVPIKNKH